MNFLANENFPLISIRLLRKFGYNVASVIEEMSGAKDLDILNRAHKEERIILTFDRDYGELIYRHRSFTPGGVVYLRFTPSSPEEPARMLSKILEEGKVSISDRFTVIERGRIRQRPLHEIR